MSVEDDYDDVDGAEVGYYCLLCRSVYADHEEHNEYTHANDQDFDVSSILVVFNVNDDFYALDPGGCPPGRHDFADAGRYDECMSCVTVRFPGNPFDAESVDRIG